MPLIFTVGIPILVVYMHITLSQVVLIALNYCIDVLQPLGTSELWKISQFINQQWKSLGRNLSVPEEDLKQVEYAYKDMRECSYQMLLKWKERFPSKCSFGSLYVALCDSGLNSVASSHCIFSRSPK